MKYAKHFIFTSVFIVVLSMGNNAIAAGPSGPPGPPTGGGPPCWPPPCVPIDGGLSFLLIAGVAYGGKKVYDISKDKEKAE